MDMIYRPLLPPTQYCPCKWTATRLNSLPHSNSASPFYRALFAPYTPLWTNQNPQTEDNSPCVDPDSPQQAGIDYRVTFERRKKTEAKYWESMASFCSLYIPRGRWQWTHQVTFENRSEEVRISYNQQYTLAIKTAKIYQETITYISKLWHRETRWDGFAREVALHKTQLRAIHGAAVPALIGIHSNFHGIQMTYDIPHHSFWIQASPDMPDVLKRRCLQVYDQLHCQGVLHGNVEFENILIGGDGRVKIINFDRSRSSKPLTKVKLEAADNNDFRMEMREVHYKLDYMGARQTEHRIWKNKHDRQAIHPPAGNTSRIHAHYPYSISRGTPVDPAKWSLPELWKPKRFVVPGQSADQFRFHLKQFLLGVAEEAGEGMDPPKFTGPTSQNLKKRKRDDNDLGDSDISEPKARKRARTGGHTDESRRKVRFEQETDYSDGTTRTKRKLAHSPPPGQRRSVPRIPRERKEAYERGLHPGSSGYAPNIPPSYGCPYIPPSFDRLDLRYWDSSRTSGSGRQDAQPVGESDKNADSQILGKRGQADGGETSQSENPPGAKRLRRTETVLSGTDDTDVDPPLPAPPRYSLRSSSRRAQSNTTRSSTRRTNSLTNLPSSSSRQIRVSATNIIPRSSTLTASSHASAEGDLPWNIYQQTSANQMILSHYSGATASFIPSDIRVITYDELDQLYQPIESRSTIETVRLVAEQIPNTLLTAASRIARTFTFGLW